MRPNCTSHRAGHWPCKEEWRLCATLLSVCSALEVFRSSAGSHLTLDNHKRALLQEHDREQHAVALIGYQDDADDEGGGRFLLLNSHGRGWGDGGFGSVSYAFFARHCREAFAAVECLASEESGPGLC